MGVKKEHELVICKDLKNHSLKVLFPVIFHAKKQNCYGECLRMTFWVWNKNFSCLLILFH